MSYRVVVDSCGELTEEMKQDGHFLSAPLTMQVDEYDFVDDETFPNLHARHRIFIEKHLKAKRIMLMRSHFPRN